MQLIDSFDMNHIKSNKIFINVYHSCFTWNVVPCQTILFPLYFMNDKMVFKKVLTFDVREGEKY